MPTSVVEFLAHAQNPKMIDLYHMHRFHTVISFMLNSIPVGGVKWCYSICLYNLDNSLSVDVKI